MSANQDNNPTNTIVTNKDNHPTRVIIYRDYFVDSKTQEKMLHGEINTKKWDKLKKKVNEKIMDYLKKPYDC